MDEELDEMHVWMTKDNIKLSLFPHFKETAGWWIIYSLQQ